MYPAAAPPQGERKKIFRFRAGLRAKRFLGGYDVKKSGFQKFLARMGVERVDESDPFNISDLPQDFDRQDDGVQENLWQDAEAPAFIPDAPAVQRVTTQQEAEAPVVTRRAATVRKRRVSADVRPAAPLAGTGQMRQSDEVDDLMDDLLAESTLDAWMQQEVQQTQTPPAENADAHDALAAAIEADIQNAPGAAQETEADVAQQTASESVAETAAEPVFAEAAADLPADEAVQELQRQAAALDVFAPEEEETGTAAEAASAQTPLQEAPGVVEQASAGAPVLQTPPQEDSGVREAFVRPHNHGVVVVLGMFDGVHAGHQHMLSMARRDADQLGLPLHVVTFYEHPASILTGAPVPYLSTLEDRIGLLTQYGMDCFDVYHFTPQFASMHYRDFIAMLVRELDMTHIVLGQDAVFGRGGQGNAQVLMREAQEFGISVHVVPDVTANGQKVSSSAIRAAIARGDVGFANACLTRPYAVVGKVAHGAKRGALLGFPTANLLPTAGMLVPANGVYVSQISLQEGTMMPAVTNIGVHPTVDELRLPVIETHILDFDGDCYDQHARVELLQMLRGEQKFDTFAQLSAQIQKDTADARAFFAAQKR
jgi:riboflavin kinase/FMN adenylyltransferase